MQKNPKNKDTYKKLNSKPFKRMVVQVPYCHYEILEGISLEEDMSISQLVRRAIELYLVTQKDVLSIPESEIALTAHLAETRSKKAMVITHAEKFFTLHSDSNKSDLSLFEELNPEAYV
jgi:hypothetical protein